MSFDVKTIRGKLYAQTVPAKMTKKELILSILEIQEIKGRYLDDDAKKALTKRSQNQLREDLVNLYDISKFKSIKDVPIIDSRRNRTDDEKNKAILFLPVSSSSKKAFIESSSSSEEEVKEKPKKKTVRVKIKKEKPPTLLLPPSSSETERQTEVEEEEEPILSFEEILPAFEEKSELTPLEEKDIQAPPPSPVSKKLRRKKPKKRSKKKRKKGAYEENPIQQIKNEDVEINPFVSSTGNFDIYNEVLNPISFPEPELTFQHKLSKLQTLQRKVILPEEDVENYEIALALEKKRAQKKMNNLKKAHKKSIVKVKVKAPRVKKIKKKKVVDSAKNISLKEYMKLKALVKKKKQKECASINKKILSL